MEYDIPLSLEDIVDICKQYRELGNEIQNQMDYFLEKGIMKGIKNNEIKRNSLIKIKDFLEEVRKNPYFGDAVLQSEEHLISIKKYENDFNMKLN